MRVPPPARLKIDRESLLRDVRQRLAERSAPRFGAAPDPADPAWAVLEQAAWMVEVFSGQLDRYPFAVLQQVVHLLGGELLPALPALGVVVVDPLRSGSLASPPGQPGRFRFFAGQTEARGPIELVPVETPDVHPGGLLSLVEVGEDVRRVERLGPGLDVGAQVAWRGEVTPSDAFAGERVRYVVAVPDAASWRAPLEAAIDAVRARKLGWLELSVEAPGPHDGALPGSQLAVVARIDVGVATRAAVPSGVCPGGDVAIGWGALDGVAWAPGVRVSSHPALPRAMRGQSPLRLTDDELTLPDVPAGFPARDLLDRVATPMPWEAIDALWRMLVDADKRLAALAPVVRRELPSAVAPGHEARWIASVLADRDAKLLEPGPARTIAHVALGEIGADERTVRVAVVAEGEPAGLSAWGLGRERGRSSRGALAWAVQVPSAPLPGSPSRGAVWTVAAYDVPVAKGDEGLLVEVPGRVRGLLLNAVLVANLPALRDGRHVDVDRYVPEAIGLLCEDVVTPAVLERVLAGPLPPAVRDRLAAFPLARASVGGQEAVLDWSGVAVDAPAGRATLNAPDAQGRIRSFVPGTRIRLDWYRRTDGAAGNLPAGAVTLVEEDPGAGASIARVYNPVPTFGGADRETAEAAVERIFAPSTGVPVLPGDFERWFRLALGAAASGWTIRCWSYAERTFVTPVLWPMDGSGRTSGDVSPEESADVAKLRRSVATAEPDALLVTCGPTDRAATPEEVATAARTIEAEVERLSRRLPAIRRAIVARFWPLTLILPSGEEPPPLPCHDCGRIRGRVRDPAGRVAELPRSGLLLNAAVVAVERATPEPQPIRSRRTS